MRLSIFNSKQRSREWLTQLMLSFFVGYLLSLSGVHFMCSSYWWANRDLQSPGLQNTVILERFAHDSKKKKILVVGSSVATQLPPEGSRPLHVSTLFVQGGGGLTGLEAVVRSQAAPELVLIETDFLNRGINKQLISEIFNSKTFFLKKVFSILRWENNLVNMIFKSQLNPVSCNDLPKEQQAVWESKLQDKLDYYLNEMSSCYMTKECEDQLIQELKRCVTALEKRGSKIVFFMDPIHPKLQPCFLSWHKRVSEEFPHHPMIRPDEGSYYYLTDGMHFFAQSGLEYFEYLIHAAEKGVES